MSTAVLRGEKLGTGVSKTVGNFAEKRKNKSFLDFSLQLDTSQRCNLVEFYLFDCTQSGGLVDGGGGNVSLVTRG